MQSIKMSLMAKVLGCGELDVDTLRLEDDSNVTSQTVWILGGVESQDEGAARNRDHQSRKNTKQSCFAAAIRSKQSEQFGWADVKGNAIQRATISVAMHKIWNRNYGRSGDRNLRVGASNGVCGHIGDHRLFYDEMVLSIISVNKRGR